jgi:hypothetical protein
LWAFISVWSWGIVVASTSMPRIVVAVGLFARPIGAAAPVTPSSKARDRARTSERRTRLYIDT